jgi:L-asparagine transporter-like permease
MFVCIATTSSEVTSHLKIILVPGISSPRQVLPLITFIYLIIFFIIIYSCIGLILMGPNRSPYSDFLLPCSPLNHWVVLLLLYIVLGLILHYVHVPIILLFYSCSCQDHYF